MIPDSNGKFKFEYFEEPKKLLIEETDWLQIFDLEKEKQITDTYVTYFANRPNAEYKTITCTLKSNGKYNTEQQTNVQVLPEVHIAFQWNTCNLPLIYNTPMHHYLHRITVYKIFQNE